MPRYMVIPQTDYPEYILDAENEEEALESVKESLRKDGLHIPKMVVVEMVE